VFLDEHYPIIYFFKDYLCQQKTCTTIVLKTRLSKMVGQSQVILENQRIRVIVFEPKTEVIVKWIP
jgi:hypothetical protein